jgi:hypothetical protein
VRKFTQQQHRGCGGNIIVVRASDHDKLYMGCDRCGMTFTTSEPVPLHRSFINVSAKTHTVTDIPNPTDDAIRAMKKRVMLYECSQKEQIKHKEVL